jgi:nuclear pore complex protein Nup98-Nup96
MNFFCLIVALGATSTPAFGTTGAPAFGYTNTHAFGPTSIPAFGVLSVPFGFGFASAFGQSSSTHGSTSFGRRQGDTRTENED